MTLDDLSDTDILEAIHNARGRTSTYRCTNVFCGGGEFDQCDRTKGHNPPHVSLAENSSAPTSLVLWVSTRPETNT